MTTAYPIPSPFPADSTALSDAQWITDVRDGLQDYPLYAKTSWQANGTDGAISFSGGPIVVPNAPINDGSLMVRDNTAGIDYTVITSGTPTSTQVLANYNTGELIFNAPPPTGDIIQVSYQQCKWRDYTIMTNLYAGLRAMFPTIGKTYTDESIQINVLQWDYVLPDLAQDPRARVLKVEIEDPYINVEPFLPLQNWEMIGVGRIHLPEAQRYSPVAKLRITGWGPYLTLGDLEPQVYHLPILYALGKLLPKQETKRIRDSTAVPVAQEGGQQPGLLTQTGDYFEKQFEIELQRLARIPGPGWAVPVRSTYDRRRTY